MPTEIVRRDPFATAFGALQSPFRDVFERVFDDPFFRVMNGHSGDEGSLALDVYEKDNKLVVEASLPGYRKDEVGVQVHDGILSITAQRSQEREDGAPDGKYYRRERTWGALSRRVALPGIVDDAPVEAALKNGVLTLTIPMPEQKGPKQIEIQGD